MNEKTGPNYSFVELSDPIETTMPCQLCGSMHTNVTDFLMAQPSFLHGLSRALTIFGPWETYNYSETDDLADENAIRNDWVMVGQDLCRAAAHGRHIIA